VASIEMNVEQLTHRVEERDGRVVVVLAHGADEVVIVPRDVDGWLSIWGLSLAFDRHSGEVRDAELGGDYRGNRAPASVVQSPLGGPSSGAG
jgi:hypothetical protein